MLTEFEKLYYPLSYLLYLMEEITGKDDPFWKLLNRTLEAALETNDIAYLHAAEAAYDALPDLERLKLGYLTERELRRFAHD